MPIFRKSSGAISFPRSLSIVWVDTNAEPPGDGSAENPFTALEDATSVMTGFPGTEVWVMPGAYGANGRILRKSGIYRAIGDVHVVVDANPAFALIDDQSANLQAKMLGNWRISFNSLTGIYPIILLQHASSLLYIENPDFFMNSSSSALATIANGSTLRVKAGKLRGINECVNVAAGSKADLDCDLESTAICLGANAAGRVRLNGKVKGANGTLQPISFSGSASTYVELGPRCHVFGGLTYGMDAAAAQTVNFLNAVLAKDINPANITPLGSYSVVPTLEIA